MRSLTALVSSAFAFLCIASASATIGCAGNPAPPAAAPAPIVYNAADYNPPSEFDMSFAAQAGGATNGTARKSAAPVEASYRARLVSMEKPSDEVAR